MKKTIILVLSLMSFLSCTHIDNSEGQKKFEKEKWAIREGRDFPYRGEMLNDLTRSFKWKGMKKDSVLKLLGAPGRIDNNHLFYLVSQERLGLFPLHTKSLVVKLDSTDKVIWLKIHN